LPPILQQQGTTAAALNRHSSGSNNKTFLSSMQVALKLLLCWQGVVVNSQDVVKPYIHGLLPPVVSVLLLSSKWQAHGNSASLHSFTTIVLHAD
jgi:hypothetical protein